MTTQETKPRMDPHWPRKFRHTLRHTNDEAALIRAIKHQWALTSNLRDLIEGLNDLDRFRRERLLRLAIENVPEVRTEFGRVRALLTAADRAFFESLVREHQNQELLASMQPDAPEPPKGIVAIYRSSGLTSLQFAHLYGLSAARLQRIANGILEMNPIERALDHVLRLPADQMREILGFDPYSIVAEKPERLPTERPARATIPRESKPGVGAVKGAAAERARLRRLKETFGSDFGQGAIKEQ